MILMLRDSDFLYKYKSALKYSVIMNPIYLYKLSSDNCSDVCCYPRPLFICVSFPLFLLYVFPPQWLTDTLKYCSPPLKRR